MHLFCQYQAVSSSAGVGITISIHRPSAVKHTAKPRSYMAKKSPLFALFLHISFIPRALRTMPLHTSHARENAKNSATKNFSYGNSKSSKRYTNATTWLGTFEY